MSKILNERQRKFVSLHIARRDTLKAQLDYENQVISDLIETAAAGMGMEEGRHNLDLKTWEITAVPPPDGDGSPARQTPE